MKRKIALILAIAMMFTILPTFTSAAEPGEIEVEFTRLGIAGSPIGIVNLTEIGNLNWKHYGATNESTINAKASPEAGTVITDPVATADSTRIRVSNAGYTNMWSDGSPTPAAANNVSIGFRYGTGAVAHPPGTQIGYTFTVRSEDGDAIASFTEVVGPGTRKLSIYEGAAPDFNSDAPVYEGEFVSATGTGANTQEWYLASFPMEEGVTYTVKVDLIAHTENWAYLGLGAIMIGTEPEPPDPPDPDEFVVTYTTFGAANGGGAFPINLTDTGNLNWRHFGISAWNSVDNKANPAPGAVIGPLVVNSVMLLGTPAYDGQIRVANAGYTAQWSDGSPSATGSTTGTAGFRFGTALPASASRRVGYRFTLSSASMDAVASFIETAGACTRELSIFVGDNPNLTTDEPIYHDVHIGPDSQIWRKVSFPMEAGETYTVVVRQTALSASVVWGYLGLGSIMIGSEVDYLPLTFETAPGNTQLNLTDRGDMNWAHFPTAVNASSARVSKATPYPGSSISAPVGLAGTELATSTNAQWRPTWTDGAPTATGTNVGNFSVFRHLASGVVMPTNGDRIGFEFTVKSPQDATVSFNETVGAGTRVLSVYVDGADKPSYVNTFTPPGTEQPWRLWSFPVEAEKEYLVRAEIIEKTGGQNWGYLGISAIYITSGGEPVDKSALQALVDELDGAALGRYTAASAAAFPGALQTAKDTLANAASTPTQFGIAYKNLSDALNVLVPSGDYTGVFNPVTGNLNGRGGLIGIFGWDGDNYASVPYIDGSYHLRDRNNQWMTFGIPTTTITGKVDWSLADGYFPCYVSAY